MTPIITLNRPMRIAIEDLPQWMEREHTATPMLIYMCRNVLLSQRFFLREELIKVMATLAPHKVAALEWNLMRIAESLPLAGWRVAEIGGRVYLTKLDDMDFGRVVEQHRRRYG